MKSKNLFNDLKALSPQELKQRGAKAAEELMKLRFRNKTGQLKESHQLMNLRREIARIKTLMSQHANEQGKA